MDYYFYPYIALVGGGDGALDSLDGSLLKDGDAAFVIVPSTKSAYIYTLDADSGLTEDGINIISPDSNAGDKRWIRTNSTIKTTNVKYYGAIGDGVTDDTVAIQLAIDSNPNSAIEFGDASNSYLCSDSIILVDAAGRNFQGDLIGDGATVTFTNDGSATDTDAEMERGFAVYPTSVADGSDILGWVRGTIQGLNITCPTNGAGLFLANSQQVNVVHCKFTGGRYGVATECCINTVFKLNTFINFINAGIGLIMSSDTARVCYNSSVSPGTTYWNDSPQILYNGFYSNVAGGLAHILDMGSMSERIRNIQGNYFYSGSAAATQYGYLTRNSQPKLDSNWFEKVNYPVRILSTNTAEGGAATTLTGVTGAQPDGTFALGDFVDGYSYTGSFENNYTKDAVDDYTLSGMNGVCRVGQNYHQDTTGVFLKSTQSGGQLILDLGNEGSFSGAGFYKSLDYNCYRSLAWATTTNDDAIAGLPGEFKSSIVVIGSAQSLTSTVALNVTSLDLTAGDWDVWGTVAYMPGASTDIGYLIGGIGPTSATMPGDTSVFAISPAAVPTAVAQIFSIPTQRISLAATTTYYLVSAAIFSVSTLSTFGSIKARRVR